MAPPLSRHPPPHSRMVTPLRACPRGHVAHSLLKSTQATEIQHDWSSEQHIVGEVQSSVRVEQETTLITETAPVPQNAPTASPGYLVRLRPQSLHLHALPHVGYEMGHHQLCHSFTFLAPLGNAASLEPVPHGPRRDPDGSEGIAVQASGHRPSQLRRTFLSLLSAAAVLLITCLSGPSGDVHL